MKRNLKNLTHWIAELRDIAFSVQLRNEKGRMNREDKKYIFCKYDFGDRFTEGLSPQEAFDEEMEEWKDNQ